MSIATHELHPAPRLRPAPHPTGRGVPVDWSLGAGDVAAVPALRRQILHHLTCLVTPGSDLSAAEVIVGELLANAVAHTDRPATVTLDWVGGHPRLSVRDPGPDLVPARSGGPGTTGPAVGLTTGGAAVGRTRQAAAAGWHGTVVGTSLPEDPLSECGRGLYLVARLALDLDVTRQPQGGTLVRVVLNLTRSG